MVVERESPQIKGMTFTATHVHSSSLNVHMMRLRTESTAFTIAGMGLGIYAGSSQRPAEVVISELQCKGTTIMP